MQMTQSELLDAIIDYESGGLSEYQEIQLFQELVDTGLAWSLQGSYGRRAEALLNEGLLKTKASA